MLFKKPLIGRTPQQQTGRSDPIPSDFCQASKPGRWESTSTILSLVVKDGYHGNGGRKVGGQDTKPQGKSVNSQKVDPTKIQLCRW